MSTSGRPDDQQTQQREGRQKQLKTKNKYKKSSSKDMAQASTRKQTKLTTYFATNLSYTSQQSVPQPQQSKLSQLKEQLQSKQRQIQKIREGKDYYQHKYSTLYMENKIYKTRARDVIVRTLQQQAEIRRRGKRKVDSKLGFFVQGLTKFVQGESVSQIKDFIHDKANELTKLQSQLKKSRSEQQKDRIKYMIMYLKKQIVSRQKQLKSKQRQVFLYKQKLKLGIKQLTCHYEKQGWPLIPDSSKNYVTLELLGKGGFGQVYKCYDLEFNDYVAIKINYINMGNSKDEIQNTLKHVKRQVLTHKQLNHPNIASIRQILQISKNKIVFALQFCQGPELSLYLKQRKCIQQKDAKQIIHQIFSALNYLSELETKVIHYDLKPSNIIFQHGVLKIVDFGLCKLMDSEDSRMQLTSQGVGTYWYLPPQTFALDHATITDKVDIWSAGVIFYQMLYGKRPFANNVPQMKIIRQDLITKQSKDIVFPSQNPNKYRISQQARNFIMQCLQVNPQKRLSANEAYNHSYFKK